MLTEQSSLVLHVRMPERMYNTVHLVSSTGSRIHGFPTGDPSRLQVHILSWSWCEPHRDNVYSCLHFAGTYQVSLYLSLSLKCQDMVWLAN